MLNKEDKIFITDSHNYQPIVEYDYHESTSDIDFNHILELACFITNSPISFISFFENNVQRLKYTIGIPTSELPYNQSLCQFPINENGFYEIEDVNNNAQVKALLKKSDFDFKYFAGLPLVSPKGVIVGTICVIDLESKKLKANQIKAFKALGLQVINNLELHKKNVEEQKSRLKAEEFSNLFNSSPDLFCILSSDLNILFINSAVHDIMGFNVADCMGVNISKFVYRDDRQSVIEISNHNLKNKIKQFSIETRILTKNKKIKWVSWNASTKNKTWFVTGRDITKHKVTVQLLNQLSTVASKINNGVVISNPENNVVWINNAFTNITGYTLEDLEFQKLGDVIIGANSNIDIIEKARVETKNKKSFSVELLAYRKNGDPIWLSIFNTIILDHKGEVESLVEIIADITERKKVEEELGLLSLVASKTENGVSINDKTGRVKWINDAMIKLLGYELHELEGKRAGDVVRGANTDFKRPHESAEASRKLIPYNVELSVYKKDGTPVWISVSNTPILDINGNLEREIEIINDISERKQAELQLLEAKEQALHLSKAKEMFLSVLSHEIRTPLNAVIGLTNILQQEEKLDKQVQVLNLLEFSSENLLHLINDILDLSKIEVGKMDLEVNSVNLNDLLNDIVNSLSFKANENGVTINYKIDKDVPSLVMADKTRLYQILINLIINALKFTKKGFVQITVSLKAKQKSQTTLHFEVKDSGIGIAENKLESIFETFTQAETGTARKYGGTGLGLSITKKLIELYNGKIEVKSTLGKGTVFYFDLKFDNHKEKITLDKSELDFDRLINTRILVVDDNEINRILAKKVLSKFHVIVETAESGEKAIEMLESKNFDILLLDIHMPGLSGYETSEKLRAIDDVYFKELPIIALTASVMHEDLHTIYKYGMNDFQLKPFKPNDLASKIIKNLIKK
jgi:PAS domain S-box-containing protein